MDYSRFKYHPRVLELRLTLMHSLFVSEYGSEKTAELFRAFCEAGNMNWSIIASTIGRKDAILKLAMQDRVRFRQEAMLMGLAWGENRTNTGRRYLGISRRLVYEIYDGALKPDVFLVEEWEDKLTYSIEVAGVAAYGLELRRFLDFLNLLAGVMSGVLVAKI